MYDFSYCSFERMPPRNKKGFEGGSELMKTVPYFCPKYRNPWVGSAMSEA